MKFNFATCRLFIFCCSVIFSQTALADTDTTLVRTVGKRLKPDKWEIGASLVGGLVYSGSDLNSNTQGFPAGPGDWIFRTAGADVDVRHWLSPTFGLSMMGGFMKAKLPGRSPNMYGNGQPGNYWSTLQVDWDIYFIPLSLGLMNREATKDGSFQIKSLGLEMYYFNGNESGGYTMGIDTPPYYEFKHVTASQRNLGAGIYGFWGYQHPLIGNLSWQLLALARIGRTKQISHTSPSDFTWSPISFYPTGLYLKIGLIQNFI